MAALGYNAHAALFGRQIFGGKPQSPKGCKKTALGTKHSDANSGRGFANTHRQSLAAQNENCVDPRD